MENQPKLNPCFVCGCEEVNLWKIDGGEIGIFCKNCGANMKMSYNHFSKNCLVSSWNEMKKRYDENCRDSYNFIEPPLIFPDSEIEQARPNGLYFDWVGLCKNKTLTFGRESVDKCEIVLSHQIYSNEDGVKEFHTEPNLDLYWKNVREYLTKLKEFSPTLYHRVLDLVNKYNLKIKEELQ